MTRDPFEKLLNAASAKAAARRAETFEMINARPGAKVVAMVELLAKLQGVPIASMLTDAISERLAMHASSDPKYAEAILDAAEQYLADHPAPSEESALGLLMAGGVLNIETDNPLIRSMQKKLFGSTRRDGGAPKE